jgi:hypothetical protein
MHYCKLQAYYILPYTFVLFGKTPVITYVCYRRFAAKMSRLKNDLTSSQAKDRDQALCVLSLPSKLEAQRQVM